VPLSRGAHIAALVAQSSSARCAAVANRPKDLSTEQQETLRLLRENNEAILREFDAILVH